MKSIFAILSIVWLGSGFPLHGQERDPADAADAAAERAEKTLSLMDHSGFADSNDPAVLAERMSKREWDVEGQARDIPQELGIDRKQSEGISRSEILAVEKRRMDREAFARDFLKEKYRVYRRTDSDESWKRSVAHADGAIDLACSGMRCHQWARELSAVFGPDSVVVFENVSYKDGRKVQVDTTYWNGIRGRARHHEPARATADHLHLQPNREPSPYRDRARREQAEVERQKQEEADRMMENADRMADRASEYDQ